MHASYCRPSLPFGLPLGDSRRWRLLQTLPSSSDDRLPYAYDDWASRGRAADTVLAYRDHYGDDDHLAIYFRPDVGVLRVDVDGDYFDATLTAAVDVDEFGRTVALRRARCRSRNHWPAIFVDGAGPPSGEGGVWWLRRVDAHFRGAFPFEISFPAAVSAIFGPDWSAVVPPTAPRATLDDLARAEESDGMYRAFVADGRVPWGRTVSLHDPTRTRAATTIQRFYRGWRVRMRTAFDPRTSIGRFYALREFRRTLLFAQL